LSWDTHIDRITKKANSTLGFLRRNIRVHSEPLKSSAYKVLVRPQLEYCSSVWSPHTNAHITQIESVQRRAARWAKHDYGQTSSFTEMLQSLKWRRLDLRRIDSRLILMYKITHNIIAIPVHDYPIPLTRQSSHDHSSAYRLINAPTDYYKFSFFPRTVVHWNCLPPDIPACTTLELFSQAVCQIEHISP
jgi:hypothetical protein